MRSNSYTLIFTSLITIFFGFLLSVAATSLKPRQDINIEIDMKKNILEARFWCKQALENDDEYIGALAQQVWDDFKLGSY